MSKTKRLSLILDRDDAYALDVVKARRREESYSSTLRRLIREEGARDKVDFLRADETSGSHALVTVLE